MSDQETYDKNQSAFHALDPAVRVGMVDIVRAKFAPGDLRALRTVIANDPLTWWLPHHFFFGMSVRNVLRTFGYGEDAIGVQNLDDYWVAVVEEAVK